jgi:hypothetical protein
MRQQEKHQAPATQQPVTTQAPVPDATPQPRRPKYVVVPTHSDKNEAGELFIPGR